MHKKIKDISKTICTIFLTVFLLSSECFAANDEIAPYGLSGFRCLNSTCGGAYLRDNPPGIKYCNTCNEHTDGYMCPVCGRQYDICGKGHYYDPWS